MAAQVQNGTFLCRRNFAWLPFLLLTWAFASTAGANEAGLAWLLAQQQSGGEIAAAPDETTPHQATFEALRTLHALSHGGGDQAARARQYLADDGAPDFPYLPRRMIASHLAGQPVSGLVSGMRIHQNPDGGFAAWPGEQSTVLDTVEALEALAAVGVQEQAVIQPALQYIVARQRADGSFAHSAASPASIALTARAVGVFQQHLFDYNLAVSQQAAASFLWQRLSAEGWGETWEGAHALLALIPITTDATRYAVTLAALQNSQEANGSWGGSVYATALVLRVLFLAEHRELPPDPTTGSLTGQFQDGGTGLPLAGVQIALPGTGTETHSRADGGFELTGLEAGDYLIEYSRAGYTLVTQQVRVQAGRRLDVGTVAMQPLADFGLLQGRVTDGETGSPIGGAVVEVNGSATATAGDGSFQRVLPPGPIAISVHAVGYVSVSATGTMAAGATLQFSPALLPEGTEPDSVLTLRGIVLDGTDGTPISGARISTPPAADVLAGPDGVFRLEELVPGSLAVTVQADGYQGVQLSILAAQGGELDLGALRLARVEKPVTSALRGVVQDADGGAPIAGATVIVGGRTTESDTDGRYVIEGNDALSFTLSASAPGYFSQQYSVQLSEHGNAEMNVALQRAVSGGLAITSMTPDRPSYPAYSQIGLDVTLESSADQARAVRLYVRVFNAFGALIEEFAVAPDAAGGTKAVTVAPGTMEETMVTWYNRHYAPGSYRLLIQAQDAESAEVLAERAVQVLVTETRQLDYLRLASNVSHANQGTTETVQLLLSLRNRSNVPIDANVSYQWKDPVGEVIHTDSHPLRLDPETIFSTLHAARLEQYLFDSAGNYPFEIVEIFGVEAQIMEAGAVTVAPDVRIEIEQGVEPGSVLPQGDARLRMKIRIEGVQLP
jgi:hypothetical protein